MQQPQLSDSAVARMILAQLGPNGEAWGKGSYNRARFNDLTVEHCMLGGWREAMLLISQLKGVPVSCYTRHHEALEKLARIIREQYPERVEEVEEGHYWNTIISFNDHGSTEWTDVHSVLQKLEAE